MSLSKFYQNSPIFQPEGLIKREQQPSSGWQPLQQIERVPFKTEDAPEAVPEKNIPTSSPNREEVPKKEDAPANSEKSEIQQNSQDDRETVPVPVQQEVDLSQYLERHLAEKQIEEAYQRGLQEGREKVEQDFDAATRALLSSCQQLDTIRETIISNSSSELLEFALTIAEKILRISVREQDQTIIATIEEALQRAVKSDEFTVYIHPDDYDCVSQNSAELIAGLTGLNKVVVKRDNKVERGGAKLESDNCTIDATIASQFDLIREEIKKD